VQIILVFSFWLVLINNYIGTIPSLKNKYLITLILILRTFEKNELGLLMPALGDKRQAFFKNIKKKAKIQIY